MDYSSSTLLPVSESDVLQEVLTRTTNHNNNNNWLWYKPSTSSSQQNVSFPSFPSSQQSSTCKCDEDFVIGHVVTIGGDDDWANTEAIDLEGKELEKEEEVKMLIDDEPDIVFLGQFSPRSSPKKIEQKSNLQQMAPPPPPPPALSMPCFPQHFTSTPTKQIREPTFNLLDYKCEPVKAKLGRPKKKSTTPVPLVTSKKIHQKWSFVKKEEKNSLTTTSNAEQANWWVQLLNVLTSRYSKLSPNEKAQIDPHTFRPLVRRIELRLHECHQRGSAKYARQYIRIRLNLSDPKNRSFCRRVMLGLVTPEQLATMSSDEMADEQLAEWRKMEQQHSVELMVKDAQDRAQFAKQNIRVKEGDLFEDGVQGQSTTQPAGGLDPSD